MSPFTPTPSTSPPTDRASRAGRPARRADRESSRTCRARDPLGAETAELAPPAARWGKPTQLHLVEPAGSLCPGFNIGPDPNQAHAQVGHRVRKVHSSPSPSVDSLH